jgi:hypothetical protein
MNDLTIVSAGILFMECLAPDHPADAACNAACSCVPMP